MSNKRDKNKAARKKKNKKTLFHKKVNRPKLPEWKTDGNGNKIKLEWS